jgi:uncharacterized protein
MDASAGTAAVRTARAAAEAEVRGTVMLVDTPAGFDARSGVFVTINLYPEGILRGCIGYPEPVLPLKDALVQSARSACHDPRFPALEADELSHVTFEVTVLSVPVTIQHSDADDLMSQIVLGRDGLVLTYGNRRAVFLPQVPVEWDWTKEEYLDNLSAKAGLPAGAWRDPGAALHAFTGEVFAELEPRGEIVRKG